MIAAILMTVLSLSFAAKAQAVDGQAVKAQAVESSDGARTSATQASAPSEILTLDQALSLARERNPDLQAAQARLQKANELGNRVLAAYLPQISVGGGYTYNSVEAVFELPAVWHVRRGFESGPPFDPEKPMSPENPPGIETPYFLYPAQMVEAVLQRHHQLGGQVTVEQAILAPALIPAFKQSELAKSVAALHVEHARQEVLFTVARLYFGAVGLKESIDVRVALLETMRAHETDARGRFERGVAPRLAVLKAELDRIHAEKELLAARNAYQVAKLAVAALLDRDHAFEVTRPEPVPLPPEWDALVSSGASGISGTGPDDGLVAQRPDVRAARENQKLAKHVRQWDWTAYAPNLGLSGQYQLSNVQGFFNSYGLWAVTVGLSWNLFDGGLREVQRRENVAQLAQAEAEARATDNRARTELRRAALELQNTRASLELAEKQLELAREAHEVARGSFDAGAATWLEVSDAHASLLAAELGKVAEELNVQLATLDLLKAAGAFDAN